MRVLIVVNGFFPGLKYGGPPVSIENLCTLLSKDYEFYILTRNHDYKDEKPYDGIATNVWINKGRFFVKYLEDKDFVSHSFKREIEEIRPQVLYLQSIFEACVLPCLNIAKKRRIKVIIPPRGELGEKALSINTLKKQVYLQLLRHSGLLKQVAFQASSNDERNDIIRNLRIPNEKIFVVPNVPSLPNNSCVHNKKEKGSVKLFYYARIHPIKNLLFALNCLSECTGNIEYDIYGPIEDQEYWAQCSAAITNLPPNIRVRYAGLLSHNDTFRVICGYDALFLPTYGENFGQSIAEALVAGCLVLISDRTPWTDVSTTKESWALSLSDEVSFKIALKELVDMDDCRITSAREKTRTYFQNKVNLAVIRKMYIEMLAAI